MGLLHSSHEQRRLAQRAHRARPARHDTAEQHACAELQQAYSEHQRHVKESALELAEQARADVRAHYQRHIEAASGGSSSSGATGALAGGSVDAAQGHGAAERGGAAAAAPELSRAARPVPADGPPRSWWPFGRGGAKEGAAGGGAAAGEAR
jgi:hypothetical protein